MRLQLILWFVVVLIILFALGWLAFGWLFARSHAEIREAERIQAEVNAISMESAATQAMALLSDVNLFHCVESPVVDEQMLQPFAPELQKVLKQYELIEVGTRWALIGRSSIGTSTLNTAFTRIGFVEVGSDVEGEICVRGDNETVFEVHSDGIDPALGAFNSIYHWIIAIAGEERRGQAEESAKVTRA